MLPPDCNGSAEPHPTWCMCNATTATWVSVVAPLWCLTSILPVADVASPPTYANPPSPSPWPCCLAVPPLPRLPAPQHIDTGEVLMQAFADRAALSETMQTKCVCAAARRAAPPQACSLVVHVGVYAGAVESRVGCGHRCRASCAAQGGTPAPPGGPGPLVQRSGSSGTAGMAAACEGPSHAACGGLHLNYVLTYLFTICFMQSVTGG